MGSILDLHNEWRDTLRIASFRGVYFHAEASGRRSGRRTVLHQYPKRNLPYAEDMGREAVHWQFSAYIILNDRKLNRGGGPYAGLIAQRNALVEALEMDGPGELIHPSLSMTYGGGRDGASVGGPMMCMVESYGVSESRTKGAFYEFDLNFVEAGEPPTAIGEDSRRLLELSSAKFNTTSLGSYKKLFQPSGSPLGGGLGGLSGISGPSAIRRFQGTS